jgi:hypothetical protein
VAPAPTLVIALGAGSSSGTTAADLTFGPNAEPAEVVPAILAELARRGLVRP